MQDFHLTLKTRLIYKYVLSFTILFLVGCSSYPDTPEEVVKQYIEYSSNGECEKAMELCYGGAKEINNALIDSGCEPYSVTVDSIDCEIRDTNCVCAIYEIRDLIGDLTLYIGLTQVDGKWKVSNLTKDAGPWSWVDYGANQFYNTKEGDDYSYENPVELIDLIFNNYIKYDNSIESDDDKEVMSTCLNQLDSKLTVDELTIILNIWMYYCPIDFPNKKLTDSIFRKNKQKSKIAIEKRIANKFDWELENFGSYGELTKLLRVITSEIEESNSKKPITNSEEVNTMIYFNATKDTVQIEYSGQCIYEYPILQNNDSIYVYFDTIEDCVYRSGVKEFYNLPQGEFPRIGDLFLVVKIDSIRSYNRFLFPRWVDSVNSIHEKRNILTSEFIVPRY